MTIADSCCASDDSDEDDEEEEPEDEGGEQVEKEGEVKSEVKTEPGTSKKKKDANELHIYQEDELKLFKPDQLHADVQLLDGACVMTRHTVCSHFSPNRETAEGQAKSRSPERV